ncbi:hypothetical protein [Pseudactinotalea sp.]|uniref:hypothetical protein n=1 Tax=Pseudactinotalea sp. TaxID=1926260 RepID=UPI003B3AAF00
MTVYDDLGRLVPHVPALPELPDTDHDNDPASPRTSECAADRRSTDPLPLDPVNGGPLELEYAVGVVAERWHLHSVG